MFNTSVRHRHQKSLSAAKFDFGRSYPPTSNGGNRT
jgi:hypothetical protein